MPLFGYLEWTQKWTEAASLQAVTGSVFAVAKT
jgi:hypothetical protein